MDVERDAIRNSLYTVNIFLVTYLSFGCELEQGSWSFYKLYFPKIKNAQRKLSKL